MEFLLYYLLDEKATPEAILKGATVLEKAKIELEGYEVKQWLVTPEYWGMVVVEADNAVSLAHGINQWRQAIPGIYKEVKYSVALKVEEYVPKMMDLVAMVNKAKK